MVTPKSVAWLGRKSSTILTASLREYNICENSLQTRLVSDSSRAMKRVEELNLLVLKGKPLDFSSNSQHATAKQSNKNNNKKRRRSSCPPW
jgi:hypothetical protein